MADSQNKAFSIPALPANMPEAFVRDVRECEILAKKKRVQIQRLEADVTAIEKRILVTIAEWQEIKTPTNNAGAQTM